MKTFLNVTALLTATLSLASCGGGGPPAVDTTAPTIALTATPNKVDNSVAVVKLSAVATDDVGVTEVTFYEGANKISVDTTAPYEAVSKISEKDFSEFKSGDTLKYRAVATDAAGNVKESIVEVAVTLKI